MTKWFWFFLFLLPAYLNAQQCLSLLDSAIFYQTTDRGKTAENLQKLVSRLDSNFCDKQIGYAEAYNNAGLLYWKLNDRRSAIDLLTKAMDEKLLEYDSFAIEMLPYYDNLYAVYRDYSEYIRAGQFLNLAEKSLANHNEEDLTYLNHLIKSGVFYKEIGMLSKSGAMLAKAKDMTLHTPVDDSIKGSVLIEAGSLYTLQGEYKLAEQDLTRAISILRTNYPALHARAVDRLAKLLMENGELAKSESNLLSNISFKKSEFPSDTLLLVESLNNLGVLYFRINDLDKSKKYFQDLVDIGDSHPEIRPFGLNNLGAIELRQGNTEAALKHFKEASHYFASTFGTLHQEYANVLNNLAGAYNKIGDYDQALSLYNQVLDLDRILFGESHPKYATSLTNLAHVYRQLGYMDVAERFIRNSTIIKQKSLGPHHHEVAKSLNDLGLMQLILKDSTQALQLFDSALHINIIHIQKIFPVLTDAQRTLAYKDLQYSLRRFSSIAFSEKYFNTKWSEKALNYTINTKSILFYASDKMRRLIQESGDPEIANYYYRWRQHGIALANAYLLSTRERQAQDISLAKLEEEYDNLEKALTFRVSAFSNQSETTFIEWQQISDAMLDSTALVEIVQFKPYDLEIDSSGIRQGFRDESRYVAFVIKPGRDLQKVNWEANNNFKKQFSLYRNSLKYSIKDYNSFGALWANIDNQLRDVRKVYFAGDGDWHEINPSIFYDTAQSKYVAEKYKLLTITSGKDLTLNHRNNWERTASVFGNPDFSVHKDLDLEELLGAEEEAKEVTDVLKKDKWKTEAYLTKKATEESIKDISNPGILHIATHGYFNENETEEPLLNSGLYLATNAKNTQEDGKVTAYEAMNLKLDETLLVVLSACETGLGQVENGEGVFGLQRAFLAAGSENLIITLMKIKDEPTQDFMNLFYKAFVESSNVQIAFFSARAEFKKSYPDPVDWGAFILISKN
ncbi:MAG: CHAT domain-containing tetratricopeptide repeat protein [Cyclobacteriaceae bacterium]